MRLYTDITSIISTDRACSKGDGNPTLTKGVYIQANSLTPEMNFTRSKNIPDGTKLHSDYIPMNRFLSIPYTKTSFRRRATDVLKPGARFRGFQTSGTREYSVEVMLLEVDLPNSYMSGTLTIHNLTPVNSIITTFFTAEIIGPRHTFITNHDSWGSSIKNDIQHWARFPSWRSLDVDLLKDYKNREWYQTKAFCQNHLYMRWKEHYLYPNPDQTEVKGASFAGFYFISFDREAESFTGIYYYKTTDRFQQLHLSFVPDHGVFRSYEYC